MGIFTVFSHQNRLESMAFMPVFMPVCIVAEASQVAVLSWQDLGLPMMPCNHRRQCTAGSLSMQRKLPVAGADHHP
jgi:hypothetical protein